MARPTEAHVEAARRMLAGESSNGGNAEERAAAARRVYDALFQSLAPVIGPAGFQALFARSVKLTKPEFPCLADIPITTDPRESHLHVAEQVVGCLTTLEPGAAARVATGLYATLFGLMTNFIGERLVWQIVKKAFPAIETGPKEQA